MSHARGSDNDPSRVVFAKTLLFAFLPSPQLLFAPEDVVLCVFYPPTGVAFSHCD